MRKSLVLLMLAGVLSVPSMASAANLWRECGIGGMLFQKTGWAAITSNIIWDLGTTATTSHVSSDDLCEGPRASTAKIIHESYASLEEEVIMGEGKHLNAMLDLLECSDKGAMLSGLKTDLSSQMGMDNYSSQNRLEKSVQFYNATMKRAASNKCSAI